MAEALASKYRPHTFEDVVGQEKVIAILQNQLETGNTKQAYCFVGGAGTGKTTLARIMARAVNGYCKTPEIIEIDAASNNGVDAIRELRESVKFKPITSKFKVYVLDEVHMLSTGAFNALLKTLEEPPSHAVFILATTDPQKIPATILSRVQRFDFNRMTVEQIVGRLQFIIDEENEAGNAVEVADDVLEYIAKLANGGMRNSISLLDTVLGYSSAPTLSDVFDILGVPDFEQYLDMMVYLHNNQQQDIIRMTEMLHVQGKDMKRFVSGLAEFLVDFQKIAIMGSYEFVQIPSAYFDRIDGALRVLSMEEVKEWFASLTAIASRIKYEHNPKTIVQGELIGLCQ